LKWYFWVGITVAVILGIWTLVPAPAASKPSLLGYRAHCSFTPVSTIICWVIAGIIYWLGKKQAPTAPEPAPSPPTLPTAPPAPPPLTAKPTPELTEVKWVGPKRAEQLKSLGVSTVVDLAKASAEDLATKMGVSPKIAGKLIEEAKKLTEKAP